MKQVTNIDEMSGRSKDNEYIFLRSRFKAYIYNIVRIFRVKGDFEYVAPVNISGDVDPSSEWANHFFYVN